MELFQVLDFGLKFTFYDITMLVALIVMVSLAYSSGFVKGVLRLIAPFIALLGAKVLSAPVTLKVYDILNFDARIAEALTKAVNSSTNAFDYQTVMTGLIQNLGVFGSLASGSLLSNKSLQVAFQANNTNVASGIADKVAVFLKPSILVGLEVMVTICLFVILSILLRFVVHAITSAVKATPLLGSLDNALGGAIGVINFGILATVLYYILKLVSMKGLWGITPEILQNSITLQFISSFF